MDILLLLFSIALTVAIVFYCVRHKTFFTTSSIIFFLPLICLLFLYNLVGLVKEGGEIHLYEVAALISVSLDYFVFKCPADNVAILFSESTLYAVGFYTCVFLAYFTTISVFVGFFFIGLVNRVRCLYRRVRGADILVGESKDDMTYAKNNKNVILWVTDSHDKDFFKSLFDARIAFIKFEYNEKNIRRVASWSKNVNLICFDDDYEKQLARLLTFVRAFHDQRYAHLLEKSRFYAEFSKENLGVVDEFFKDEKSMAGRIIGFSKHESIAVELFQRENFANYLKPPYVDYATGLVDKDLEVDAYLIGLGKVNQEVLKSSVIVNQMAKSQDGKKIEPLLVNYFAYDRDQGKKNSKQRIHNFLRYDEFIKNADKGEYLPFPEKTHNLEFSALDVDSEDVISKLITRTKKRLEDKKKPACFLFISLNSDIENIDFARMAIKRFREEGLLDGELVAFHLYVRIKSPFMQDNFPLDEHYVTYFGSDARILSHEVVINESLMKMGKSANDAYNAVSGYDSDFDKLDTFTKKSNLYEALGVEVKLNLLGYASIPHSEPGKAVSFSEPISALRKKDYYLDYDPDGEREIGAYKCLSYIEHNRWNAYHIVNGYVPMKLQEVKMSNGRLVNKSKERRTHIYLTDFRGLDKANDVITCLQKGVEYHKIGVDDPLFGEKVAGNAYDKDAVNILNIDSQVSLSGKKIIKR